MKPKEPAAAEEPATQQQRRNSDPVKRPVINRPLPPIPVAVITPAAAFDKLILATTDNDLKQQIQAYKDNYLKLGSTETDKEMKLQIVLKLDSLGKIEFPNETHDILRECRKAIANDMNK